MRNSVFAFPNHLNLKPAAESESTSSSFEHQRRKFDPVLDSLQESTITWILSLPPSVRPHALAKQYPRIANILANAWAQPSLFDQKLAEYVVDNRGGRRGFPMEILLDFANLRTYFSHIRASTRTDVWCSVAERKIP